MGLKGRVKELSINHYKIEYKFGVIEKKEDEIKFNPNLPDEYYVFNEKGKIVEEYKQNSKSELKAVKEYDEKNNLIQENILELGQNDEYDELWGYLYSSL